MQSALLIFVKYSLLFFPFLLASITCNSVPFGSTFNINLDLSKYRSISYRILKYITMEHLLKYIPYVVLHTPHFNSGHTPYSSWSENVLLVFGIFLNLFCLMDPQIKMIQEEGWGSERQSNRSLREI